MTKETKDEFFKRLDTLGVAEVKTNIATNVYLTYPEKVWSREWVERSSEATSAEQLTLARRAAEEATRAANEASAATKIATAAKTIAIASMIITIIGIAVGAILPHLWR